jgi:hypothetical protein
MEDAVHAGEVERLRGEVEAPHVDPLRVPLLLGGVVVVREGVDAGDVVPGCEQRVGEMRADEARGPRDEVTSYRGTIP